MGTAGTASAGTESCFPTKGKEGPARCARLSFPACVWALGTEIWTSSAEALRASCG